MHLWKESEMKGLHLWSSYMKKDIEALEKVQKSYQDSATTKKHMNYSSTYITL